MHIDEIKKEILESVVSDKNISLIKEFDSSAKENETLFFLKPEFFKLDDFNKIEPLLDLILSEVKNFDIEISGILNLKGSFLKEKKIIERHYGVINSLSVNGSRLITDEDKEKIKEAISPKNIGDYRILGGHELISGFKEMDEERLTELWYNKNGYRIGEGFYIQLHRINNENIILINGFNPSQIKHFTSPDSQIVLFLLHTDTDWAVLRNDMVGDTFPDKAVHGSIRAELFENSKKYGIDSIDVAKNFVHASSGPFDALFEICNFVGNIEKISICKYDTNIFHLMRDKFGLLKEDFDKSLDNPYVDINGKEVDLFSFTKNKNTYRSLRGFRKIF